MLAGTRWTDPWKIDAVEARANWRGRVATAEVRERAGDECLGLIDEAIVMQPTLTLFGLRARCARAAGRKDVLVESLWYLGRGTYNGSLNSGEPARAKARRDLESIIGVIKASVPAGEADSTVDPVRVQEVLDSLGDNIRRLEES